MGKDHASTTVNHGSLHLLLRDEAGQNLVEYGLVVGLVGLGALLSFTTMGNQLQTAFSKLGSVVTSSVTH